jgi:hypothetical protein
MNMYRDKTPLKTPTTIKNLVFGYSWEEAMFTAIDVPSQRFLKLIFNLMIIIYLRLSL